MKLINLLLVMCMAAASAGAAVEYRVKKKMGGNKFKGAVTYLAAAGEIVYALEDNGRVHAFNAESCSRENDFETGLKNTQTIAVNDKGEIHVFATETRQEQRVRASRKYNVDIPIGVTCKVFDKEGKELRTLKLDMLKSAKAAHFIGGKLAVADLGGRTLFVLDPETGEKVAEVKKGLRLCCGIFDFCEGPNDTMAVSNLGAFKVQQYDLSGNKILEFGRRGKGFDDFQGCCNPVSAGYLSDGSVVTVEKSPTRIKIYDPEGKNARHIDGIDNLVDGCSHIPVAIDDAGNIFLAAAQKGYIVKCAPKP